MSALPCKNPNCSSYGTPHPNCRCYGGYAMGGEAAFCAGPRMHEPGCGYFQDGGDVIDPDQVVLDEPQAPPAEDLDQSQEVILDPPPKAAPEQDQEVTLDTPTAKYETPAQQLQTVGEGFNQGLMGPLATGYELARGIPAEDIAGREAANPWEHGLAEAAGLGFGMLTGAGEAALFSKAAEGFTQLTSLSKMGAGTVKAMLANGLIQGGDEVSSWLLGQGDPADAVGAAIAHIGAAALLGGSVAGTVATVSGGLKNVAASKTAGKLASYAAGIASAAQNPEGERAVVDGAIKGLGGAVYDSYRAGQKMFDHLIKNSARSLANTAGIIIGTEVAGSPGATVGYHLSNVFAKPLEKILGVLARPAAKRVVAPVALKIVSAGDTTGLLEALGHAENVASGYSVLGKGIDSLFRAGTPTAINAAANAYGSERQRRALADWIDAGGIDQEVQEQVYQQNEEAQPQGFAEGGVVAPKPVLEGNDGLAVHYPEQNLLLNAAKGRISNYLSSLRPPEHAPRLAFDERPDQREATKSYHRALDIANKPLGVLDEVKNGTLVPEHMQHLSALHPEVMGLLQKKLTERIAKAQMAGEKPSYKVRQGMSLLMGTALSGEMTPANIQAAQAVFRPAASQGAAPSPPKTKKSAASLTKSDQAFMTGAQARERRQQKV